MRGRNQRSPLSCFVQESHAIFQITQQINGFLAQEPAAMHAITH
jgi:hypothetical protein